MTDKGIVVFAAGNDNDGGAWYPAYYGADGYEGSVAVAELKHHLVLCTAAHSCHNNLRKLDGALKQLCRMLRGVCAATDDKHPDKPGPGAQLEDPLTRPAAGGLSLASLQPLI